MRCGVIIYKHDDVVFMLDLITHAHLRASSNLVKKSCMVNDDFQANIPEKCGRYMYLCE